MLFKKNIDSDKMPIKSSVLKNFNFAKKTCVDTIQGWIKGVNSNTLNPHNDMGQDGETSISNINRHIARDAYGYSLNYFNGDYQAIDPNKNLTANSFTASIAAAAYLTTDAPGLFNGNISSMVTSLTDIAPGSPTLGQAIPQLSAFKYDQLNRVKQMKAYRDINLSTNTWGNGSTYDGSYETHLTYDANGNILTMQRNGVAGINVNMDNFTYKYETVANGYARNTNKLRHVNDNTAYTGNYNTDLDDQGTFSINNENYAYDEIGQQTKDKSADIALQEWNVYGKVSKITRLNGSTKPDLEFTYDAMGYRVSKIVKPRDTNGQRPASEWNTTYYVKDAQGNTLAVYEQSTNQQTQAASFKLKERYMYGMTRLGANKTEIELIGAPAPGNTYSHTVGNKIFDLINHRGDIITAVTDRKIGIEDPLNLGTVAYYKPEIITNTETYLFGQPEPGRNIGLSNDRHGYQGQEKVDEINSKPGTHYTADNWELNTSTGIRENKDQVVKPWESPYATFANNPIWFADVNGKDTLKMHLQQVVSPAKNAVIFKITFELIQNGVSKVVEAPMNLSGSSDIYFGMPKENYSGGNILSKPGYDIKWQRMGSHSDLSKEWNENTILIDPSSGGLDRGQFAHPGNSLDASAGCFIPTEFPSPITIKNFPARPADMMKAYSIVNTEPSGDDMVSKDMLKQIRGLYNTSKANNSVGTFGFQLTTRPAPMELMPTIQIKSIPTGDNSNEGSSEGGSTSPSRPMFDCFISGTLITMGDRTTKPIEQLVKGDKILSVNVESMKLEVDEVLKIVSPIHDDIITLKFSDETANSNTFDHPYYVKGKGWCSYKPEQTKLKYNINVKQLTIGDTCYKFISNKLSLIELMYVKEAKGEVQTYNIHSLKNNDSYFANGILVNNEEDKTTYKFTDSALYKKYQTFSPSLLNLFRDTNVVANLHEFTFRDVRDGFPVLDCYWFNTTIQKQNDTTFTFYLRTYFPENNVDSFKQAVTLKYVLTLKNNYYSIELDSSYKALPKLDSKEINAIIQKHKKLKSNINKGNAKKMEDDIYLLDFALARGALSGSKECVRLFNNMEKDFPNYISASALEDHNHSKRILIDYGYIKNPHSTAKLPSHFKRKYEY